MEAEFNHLNHATWGCKKGRVRSGSRRASNGRRGIFSITNSGRGYFVTTVGRDEEVIRACIRNQELADQELDQLELKISAAPKSNHRPNIP